MYVDELLQRIKDAFIEEYTPGSYAYSHFNDKFARILRDCESKADAARRAAAQPKAAAPATSKAVQKQVIARQDKRSNGKVTPQRRSSSDGDSDGGYSSGSGSATGGAGTGSSAEQSGSDEDGAANGDHAAEAGFDMTKLKAVSRKALGGPPGRRHATTAARRAAEEEKEKAKSNKGKKVSHCGCKSIKKSTPDGSSSVCSTGQYGALSAPQQEWSSSALITSIAHGLSLWWPGRSNLSISVFGWCSIL